MRAAAAAAAGAVYVRARACCNAALTRVGAPSPSPCQHTIVAPCDGVVSDVFFREKDFVEDGKKLVEFEDKK